VSVKSGLLQIRVAAVIISCSLLFVSVESWLAVARGLPARSPHNAIGLFGIAFSIFVTLSIAIRSSYLWDRAVVGAVSIAFALALANAFFSLTPEMLLALRMVKSMLWTAAAVVSATILVRELVVRPARGRRTEA
jgi:hypothetical protein